MKIWIESPARQRMGEGLIPWMSGMVSCMRLDTPFPPLMCRKMWMRIVGAGDETAPPPLIHSASVYPPPQTGAGTHVIPRLDRPHNTHMLFILNHTHIYIHTHFLLSYTLPALPPVTYIACLDTFKHATRSRGGGRSFVGGKPPHCSRSVNEQLQSVGENHPCWHLGTKAGTWETS